MEEQNRPESEETSLEEMKFSSGGIKTSQPPEVPKSKQPVPVGVLWLAAVLIILGIIIVGTLVGYVAVSSINAENWGAFFAAKPERESTPKIKTSIVDEQRESDEMPLVELPSTASDNDYIVLKEEITAQRQGDNIQLVCVVENISNVACADVGADVEFFDAEGNFVDSNSAWADWDIEPGERVELYFEIGDGQDIQSYCVVEISGEPIEDMDDVGDASEEINLADEVLYLTPEEIIEAKGNDPEGWVAEQEGKEFIVTGPLLDVSASENGQVRLVKVGRGDGACYVFMLNPELFDRLDQITQGTEVCMRGVCEIFSDQPKAFILMNGEFER